MGTISAVLLLVAICTCDGLDPHRSAEGQISANRSAVGHKISPNRSDVEEINQHRSAQDQIDPHRSSEELNQQRSTRGHQISSQRDHKIDLHLSTEQLIELINSYRSAQDQIVPHRPVDEQIDRHRSVADYKINPNLNGPANGDKVISQNRSADEQIVNMNRSTSDDHICSPNPCQPGSFCLNCAIHNCSNQTTKNHLCLCPQGLTWKVCDEPKLEMSSSTTKPTQKVPENMCAFVSDTCKFGSCVPKSVYPGFTCKCDDKHFGTNCDWTFGDVFAWVKISALGIICVAAILVAIFSPKKP